MFKNIYPLFERKRLLKIEQLENMRDFPRDLYQAAYQDYSDGILTGCRLTAAEGMLAISPGIIHWQGIPYILKETYRITYEAAGKMFYLKVRFPDRTAGLGQDEYLSQIYLDEAMPEEGIETELCRFKLQPGARLRYEHTGFSDYGTEFDTINPVYAPYAAPGKSSICPELLKDYARELMQSPIKNPWDYSFCFACIGLKEPMPYEEIKAYLDVRLKQKKDYSNWEIYSQLKLILSEAHGNRIQDQEAEKRERKLLLI